MLTFSIIFINIDIFIHQKYRSFTANNTISVGHVAHHPLYVQSETKKVKTGSYKMLIDVSDEY